MYRALLVLVGSALLAAPALALAAGASASVTLVAEPLSSTPPLYPGKPAVPVGGSVRMVAIPDFVGASGKPLDPASLDYTWNIDGVEAVSSEGVGKQALIVDSPLEYRSRTVSVTVSSQDGSLTAGDTANLVASEPTLRIYKRDPLMGIIFDTALSNTYNLTGSEATLYAAPYSFPTALAAPALSWFVDGTLGQTGNLITLRPTGQGTGTASVSVTGTSGGSIDAPAASDALTVSFGSAGNGSLLGL